MIHPHGSDSPADDILKHHAQILVLDSSATYSSRGASFNKIWPACTSRVKKSPLPMVVVRTSKQLASLLFVSLPEDRFVILNATRRPAGCGDSVAVVTCERGACDSVELMIHIRDHLVQDSDHGSDSDVQGKAVYFASHGTQAARVS